MAASAAALVALASMHAEAQSGLQNGATIEQAGWWNRTNAVPPSPVPGVTLPVLTIPAPPTVPSGSIAVGAAGGQIDKAAAVGIKPDIKTGSVDQAILAIPESATGEQIANTSADAVIVACPITEFWAAVPNGQWDTLPPFDCGIGKVAGNRSPAGVWTWDLTPIAAQWLTPGGLASNGVVLVADPSPTATFQVVLHGAPAEMGIAFAANASPPRTTAAPTTTVAATTGPTTGTGGVQQAPRPVTTVSSPPTAAPTTAATTPTPTPTTTDAKPTAVDTILGNLPGGAWLLVPFALLVAVALMVVYGPLGEPATGVAREGGVSRALAARERAASDLASPSNLALEAP